MFLDSLGWGSRLGRIEELVAPCFTRQLVDTETTVARVGCVTADQYVFVATAEEPVIAAVTAERIVAASAFELVDARTLSLIHI